MESMDLAQWRKARRAEMIALRKSLPESARAVAGNRITSLLVEGFPLLGRLAIGFYWPFNAEVDPRVAMHRFREMGARTALPVVVAKGAPLEFREWHAGVATLPGVLGLPVPQSPTLIPAVVLMPPVAFDARGYRLGYGGGYFDRTLAGLSPMPLKIGLAHEASRIETIHPQAHDISMDFVITEAGVHIATAAGLLVEHDLSRVARHAEAILSGRAATPGKAP